CAAAAQEVENGGRAAVFFGEISAVCPPVFAVLPAHAPPRPMRKNLARGRRPPAPRASGAVLADPGVHLLVGYVEIGLHALERVFGPVADDLAHALQRALPQL